MQMRRIAGTHRSLPTDQEYRRRNHFRSLIELNIVEAHPGTAAVPL